jgi:WD40 repeat protein
VYDLEAGKDQRFSEPLKTPVGLAWSRDGRYIACASLQGGNDAAGTPVVLTDAATGKVVKQFEGPAKTFQSVAVAPYGRAVLFAAPEGVRLWSWDEAPSSGSPPQPPSFTEKEPFSGHDGTVLSVIFSADGKQLLSGGKDRTVRLWDVATGKELKQLKGAPGPVAHVAFTGKGKQAVGVSPERGYTSWDIDTGSVIHGVGTGKRSAWAISPDGELVLFPQNDGFVNVNKTTDSGRRDHLLHNKAWGDTVAAAFAPDAPIIAFVTNGDGLVHLADLTTDKEVGKGFPVPRGETYCLAVAPKERYVLIADEKNVTLWSLQTPPQPVRRLVGHKDKVLCLAFSPDGKHIATGSAEMTVRVWETATGSQVKRSAEHQGPVHGLAFSPDGKTIVSCGDSIRLWEWQKAPAKP